MGNKFIRSAAPTTTDQTLRFLRVMHGCLMVSIALYVVAMRVVRPETQAHLDPNMPIILAVLSAGMISIGIVSRSRFVGSAFDALRLRPDDSEALKRWRFGVILSDVLVEAVALYGFALYFLGGQIWQAAVFMVVAELLMVLWWPRRP